MELIVFDGNFAVGCVSERDFVGWYLCCRLWFWNGLGWMLYLLKAVELELILLDGNCATGCGSGTDCVGW
jgi:hypothetical protein